ncbi:hypothetical protein GCM10027020_18630 [Nocardioides salsibiostraticola]
MTDGRDHVRRSKRYSWDATGHGYPFYGRWDWWLGTLATVFPFGILLAFLVTSAPLRILIGVLAVAAAAESSRAALGVYRANANHRRLIADAISEEIGVEITVKQLAHLSYKLHAAADASETKLPQRVIDSYSAPDGSTVALVMRRDGTVTAVRRRDTR